jgi:2-polyprenyl-6-methoxyphenol hydroxylase-like FAD-dependent oxidoreductase
VPGDWLDSLRIEGPLAGFESACWWVDRPYRDGVALIGDAAAAPDPFFGNGLSLSLRDVRVLSQRLLGSPDWDAAARSYAREHDHYFTSLHTLEQWATVARYSVGPETQPARDFARMALAQGDAPDIVGRGPDQPADAAARRKFLGY